MARLTLDYNLAVGHPSIAKQWHPRLNGDLVALDLQHSRLSQRLGLNKPKHNNKRRSQMNKVRLFSIVVASLCVISLLHGLTPTRADAGDYVGDFCWNFTNQTFGVSGRVQLGVTHIGGDHYLCSGVTTVLPSLLQFPVYGNVEFVKGEIHMTLSLAGIRNGVMGIDMMKAKVSPPNLNGTFESVGVYVDKVEHSEGTFTYTPCQ